MRYRIVSRIAAALLGVFLSASLAMGDTLRKRIAADNDDVEEYLQAGCSQSAGAVRQGDSYLDFGRDDCSGFDPAMLMGLRFQSITVPKGSTITHAHLEIVVESSTCSEDIDWTLLGEDVDDAAGFTATAGNVSGRRSSNPTTAAANWKNDGDSCNGSRETLEGPEVKNVIQEIVDRAGWLSGNDMALFVSGTGRRNTYSHDNNSNRAPLLHIEYLPAPAPEISVNPGNIGKSSYEGINPLASSVILTNTGDADLNYTITGNVAWLAVAPASGTLAAGSQVTINVTYATMLLAVGTHAAQITVTDPAAGNSPLDIPVSLTVQPVPQSSACGEVPLYTENLVNPAILHLLDVSGSMSTRMDLVASTDDSTTPELKTIVQEIVDRAGWQAGNPMAFMFSGVSTGDRIAKSYDNSSAYVPRLNVTYVSAGISYTTEARVVRSSDDAYEISNGNMSLTTTNVQLGGSRHVGLRFDNVDIPQGATVSSANISFVPTSAGSNAITLTIKGEDQDSAATYTAAANNISSRTATSAGVSWNVPAWSPPTQEERIKIAKDVLSELVTDRSIAWGFGTWTGSNSSSIDYTKVHTGCKFNDNAHQTALQNAIAAANDGGTTPLEPAMRAAQKYFDGIKADLEGDYYGALQCQPKFLILITDGLGNTATTLAGVQSEAGNLADDGITTVAIGFGIDDATQISEIARISNERAKQSDTDSLYPMHNEVAGDGVPFIAQNKADLQSTLQEITTSVKAQVFYGATPAPTTSAGQEDLIVNAQFSAAGWTGDLTATEYDTTTATTGAVRWYSSSVMPSPIKAYTVPSLATGVVAAYTDATLASDNYLCKPLGDIINSTPVIVDVPPFYYPFASYTAFKAAQASRASMVYVGSNDGALHAFTLEDGVEQWRFYPNSILAKLNEASDATKDMCSSDYCHRYLVDGSPIAADIHDGTDWKTVLLCGLRRGGSSYFALDITGGKAFDDVDTANRSKFLWEFTDPQLGQTWAQPEVYRVGVKASLTDTVWAAFWGSGYSEDSLLQPAKEAYLYGVEANDASVPLWEDASGNPINRIKISSASLPDDALSGAMVAELDDDYKGDRLYVGNLYGNLYRVTDIDKNNTPQVSTLFSFNRATPDHSTPIRVKPAYAYYDTNVVWVYFGTGRYEVQADKVTSDMQYFFGLRDDLSNPSHTLGALPVFSALKATDTVTLQDYRYIFGTPPGLPPYSWAVEMNNNAASGATERVISDPLVAGGVVFFTTFTPAADVCEGTGESWLFALEYDSGIPPADPVFDINGDGVFDENDMINDASGQKFRVAAIYLGEDMASNPVLHKDTIVVGTKTGGTITKKVNLPRMRPSLRSWWEKR
ncbi:PilC/PilY family type IV pilus protein [Thiovibrio sp. JS02]